MRRGLALLILAGFVVAGCGDASSPERSVLGRKAGTGGSEPKSAESSAERVIRGWSEALRHGHVEEAASYFSLPSLVQNGTPLLRLRSRRAVIAFNVALPCGAKLVRTQAHEGYVLAEFELTNRPGGSCGTGAGGKAATAFLIKDGKIREWRRIDSLIEPGATPRSPQPAPAPEPPSTQPIV